MLKYFFFASFLFIGGSLYAQITPQPSPSASLSQTIGINKINIEYSRPSVKGRDIFGGLLPYAKIWRTGANATTVINFSNDVTLNGAELKAGAYAILSIPYQNEWLLIFSYDLDATEDTYSEKDDALRLHVKTYEIDNTESFTIDFSHIGYDKGYLNLYWATTAVSVEVGVNNQIAVENAMASKSLEMAGAFLQAAEYFVNQDLDINKALEYINHSIELKETFRNTWIKSVIMRKLKRNSEALELAEKAQLLGESDAVYSFFKNAIDKSIIELRALVPNKR